MGWVLASRTDESAVLIATRRVNHVLHAILSIFTCALWLIVWFILAMQQYERRLTVTVRDDGTVTFQEGTSAMRTYTWHTEASVVQQRALPPAVDE